MTLIRFADPPHSRSGVTEDGTTRFVSRALTLLSTGTPASAADTFSSFHCRGASPTVSLNRALAAVQTRPDTMPAKDRPFAAGASAEKVVGPEWSKFKPAAAKVNHA